MALRKRKDPYRLYRQALRPIRHFASLQQRLYSDYAQASHAPKHAGPAIHRHVLSRGKDKKSNQLPKVPKQIPQIPNPKHPKTGNVIEAISKAGVDVISELEKE